MLAVFCESHPVRTFELDPKNNKPEERKHFWKEVGFIFSANPLAVCVQCVPHCTERPRPYLPLSTLLLLMVKRGAMVLWEEAWANILH